ncbi:hypothetical protein RRG08_059281 [Elysia crispata]|uniref:Uncharacterized protein n=1 Tax=Elysia crispata TaxID=231223 RepID=A0AAE1B080_9GAST|nr:hypothetical protein RRG08_059281 [Elysia crispata]
MITDDFNKPNTSKALPGMQQNITCATREEAILDLLCANEREAYISYPVCSVGKSDHCLNLLLPKYRPLVQRNKPELKNIQSWTPQTRNKLQASVHTTDWSVLVNSA